MTSALAAGASMVATKVIGSISFMAGIERVLGQAAAANKRRAAG
jgi:hypothetical protein